jgi:endoglucanase
MNQRLKKILSYPAASKIVFGLLLLTVIASVAAYARAIPADSDDEVSKTAAGMAQSEAVAPTSTKETADKKQTDTKKPTAADVHVSAKTTALEPTYAPILSSSPRGMNLYVDPSLEQSGRPAVVSTQPVASWLGGWSGNVQGAAANIVTAAASQNKLATLVIYNIPGRDCGSYSAGGLASADHYKAWIRQLVAGIGSNKAIVILEPDALAQIDCLSEADQAMRYSLLADAVNVLATQTKAFIYIDAGHSGWISAATMTDRLKKANIGQARGFSLNVSNFISTDQNTSYGNSISASTGKAFVIDTSRNGNGSNGEWCNPRGRALGASPTTNVGGNVDAFLWVKVPGESDGTCNGGPSAGAWWEEYAQELVGNRR